MHSALRMLKLSHYYDCVGDHDASDKLLRKVLAYEQFPNINPPINMIIRPFKEHATEFSEVDRAWQQLNQDTIPSYGGDIYHNMESAQAPTVSTSVPMMQISEQASDILSKYNNIFLSIDFKGCSAEKKPIFDVELHTKPMPEAKHIQITPNITACIHPYYMRYANGVFDVENNRIVFNSNMPCLPDSVYMQNKDHLGDEEMSIFTMDGGSPVTGPAYVLHDHTSPSMMGGNMDSFLWENRGTNGWENAIPHI